MTGKESVSAMIGRVSVSAGRKYVSAVLLLFAIASMSASAADVVWTGESDSVWTNAANWAGGVVPSGEDTAVFAPAGDIAVSVRDGDRFPKTIKVASGSVSLVLHSTTFAYLSFGNNAEGIIDVAKGAVFSNAYARIEKKNLSIIKRGKGKWVNRNQMGCDGGSSFSQLVSMKVEEGTLELSGRTGNIKAEKFSVAGGARFVVSEGSTITTASDGGVSLVIDGEMELVNANTLRVATMTGSGRIVGLGKDNPIRFENPDGCSASVSILGNCPVYSGHGSVTGAVTVADLRKSGGDIRLSAPFTILVGDASLNFDSFLFYRPVPLVIEGGLMTANRGLPAAASRLRSAPIPNGCLLRGENGSITCQVHVVQNGGTLYHGEYWREGERQHNSLANRYDLNGGTLVISAAQPLRPHLLATTESPSIYSLNGGRLAVDATRGMIRNGILNEADEDSGRTYIEVGEKGGSFGGAHVDEKALPWVRFNWPMVAKTGVSDGGISIEDGVEYVFSKPVVISGGIRVNDGGLALDSAADTKSAPSFFGTGAITLHNAPLSFVSCTEDKGLEIGELRFDGAAYIRLRRGGMNENGMSGSASCAAQTLTIGSIVRGGLGSALFVTDGISSSLGETGSSKVMVTSVPDMRSSGVLDIPIFGVRQYSLDFMTYSSDAGLIPYAGYVDVGEATTAETIASASDSFTIAIGSEKTVGGFRFCGEWKAAYVNGLLNVRGTRTILLQNRCNLMGAGTVDFGDGEGLIVFGPSTDMAWNSTISASITGSGGISFASTPDCNYGRRRISLSGANGWTGGTRINSVRLELANESALGGGDVVVGGGTRNGGRLAFNAPGATFDNNFTVSGSGCRDTHWDGFSGGAMEFMADTAISGDVELAGHSRWTAPTPNVTAVVSGQVSGDSLEIVSTNVAAAGTIRFDGCNSYTGGTEVVRSVFALSKGDGAGTGPVLLDNSVLVFNNVDPITVENSIGGTNSVVRLTGLGEVELSGLDGEPKAFTLDLAARTTAIGSLSGFSQITTSRSGTTHLLVGDGDLSFAGAIPSNVQLHRRGEYSGTSLRIIIR